MKRACSCAVALACAAGPMWAACGTAPAPVLSLAYDSRYVADDPSRSQLDPDAEARAQAALRPLDDVLRALSDLSNTVLSTEGPERIAAADCALDHMLVWARAGALGDQATEAARLGVGSRIAAFALVLRQVAPWVSDPLALTEVQDWLTNLMTVQMVFWENAPSGAARGNLRAWAALAAAAISDMTGDPVLQGWSAWSSLYILCSVNPDGSLPQEMRREHLALHYQLHALAPLVTTAALLDRQGVDLMARCDQALDRAVRFAVEDLTNAGRASQAITGRVQSFFDGSAELKNFHLAWAEAYLALQPYPALEALVAPRRPLNYSKLGGDQSAQWVTPR